MIKIEVSDKILQEAQNIVDDVYAPLKGFNCEKDFKSILTKMRLSNGEVWSMPIVLDLSEKVVKKIISENKIGLRNNLGELCFILENVKIFKYDKNFFSKNLFGTLDNNHPGVKMVSNMNEFLVSGEIFSVHKTNNNFLNYLSPSDTKKIFLDLGWKSIAAFQTRNAPHRSHEHLQAEALKYVDGVFINPVIGEKKEGDLKNEYVLGSYRLLIEKYYAKNKFVLGSFNTFMRYAGPKEAVFHSLVRRNFGCTHMIIGRDHAGVGNYYDTYEAQNIFDNFNEKELGIKILKFENANFCKICKKMTFDSECSHSEKIYLSGTELRRRLVENLDIPNEFMKEDILSYLRSNKNNLFYD